MNITTLPAFRVAGISRSIVFDDESTQRSQLWQDYFLADVKAQLPAFSPTLYCVLNQYHERGYTATLGHLVANDVILPDAIEEVWVRPQQYALFDLPEKTPQNAYLQWQKVRYDGVSLERLMRVDFESYPTFGIARLYVGIKGEVLMEEV